MQRTKRAGFESRLLAVAAWLCSGPLLAQTPLKVVTTTPDYANLAAMIGGELVQTRSLLRGPENIHRIVATPSKMLALRDADLFIHTGLDLELWAPQLVRGSRNPRIRPGQPGNVDCSRTIRLKEVPKVISRAAGDIHIYGNPHYMLDPINVILVARTIRDALKAVAPNHAAEFEARYQQFERQMKRKIIEWLGKMRPYRGTKIAGYHNVLPYFADRFGLQVVGYVEERPGISPSPSYIARFIEQLRSDRVPVLLVNTWANRETAEAVARASGARRVLFPEWVGGVPNTPDVFAAFDYRINSIVEALQESAAEEAGGNR